MLSVWLRRCTWRCLTQNNPMHLFLSSILLDVNGHSVRATGSSCAPAKTSSRSSHATCCAAVPGPHSLLSMSCSHVDLTVLRSLCFPSTHTSRRRKPQCLGILRCTTCITLSSVSSTCSSARRTRTVELLNHLILACHLTSPQSPATGSSTVQSRVQ